MQGVSRNNWYPVAWADQIGRQLHPLVLAGNPILLYRCENGDIAALRDQCPHRQVPLSLGRLQGDNVECGYHGMTFDRSGSCVRIPGQDTIPRQACVESYPVHINLGLVWVWPGDPKLADPERCFDLPAWHDSNRAVTGGGYHLVKCHYQLLTDNLTDPAHTAFVHRTTLGTASQEDIPVSVKEHGHVVEVSRWTLDGEPAGVFKALADVPERVDRWQYYYLHCPSVCVVDFGICPVGALSPDDVRDGEGTVQMYSCILMAPETESTTHYFYLQVRNFAVDDRGMDDKVVAQIAKAFDEDFVVLEAQQRSMERYPVQAPVKLALDQAPTRQRKIVQRMIEAETEAEK